MLAPRKLHQTNVGIIPINEKIIPNKLSVVFCPRYILLAILKSYNDPKTVKKVSSIKTAIT